MTVLTAATKSDEKTTGEKIDDVGGSIDDASFTAMVKMTLLYHRSTSALNTKVETSNGVVTLSGKAKNAAEKVLATKLVSDVHGVKSVNKPNDHIINSMGLLSKKTWICCLPRAGRRTWATSQSNSKGA